jgi:hypothetical protein
VPADVSHVVSQPGQEEGDLAMIVDAWPRLPEGLRAEIIGEVKASLQADNVDECQQTPKSQNCPEAN